MTSIRRSLALKLSTALLAVGSLVAVTAPNADAAPRSSTIWTYYDAYGHVLGSAGLNCDGDVFEFDGDLPEGGYARHATRACDGGWGSNGIHCFSITQGLNGPSYHAISCSEIPGAS